MVYQAYQLVQELGARLGDYYPCNPTTSDTTTTIIDTALKQYFPAAISNNFNAWVYGDTGALGALNRGSERRASSWDGTSKLTFYTAWPVVPEAASVITTMEYGVHTKFAVSRKKTALSAALGQLNMNWARQVKDDSLTTSQGTWTYTLPSSQNWAQVTRVEIKINTSGSLTGYPYADAKPWNYKIQSSVSTAGVTTWYIQFGQQPPPSRSLRVWGYAYTPKIASDIDYLAVRSDYEQPVMNWLMEYATHLLFAWEGNRQPSGDAERYRIWSLDRLNNAKKELLDNAPSPEPAGIVVPGRGDGLWPGGASWTDVSYLGAFQVPGV